jgi:hypothetical protein
MAFHAIALTPTSGHSTTAHNIRLGGYKTLESATRALNRWCEAHHTKYGYVQQYGARHPAYIRGVH